MRLRDGLQDPRPPRSSIGIRDHGDERAALDRFEPVRQQAFRIDFQARAQAGARRARAVGRVEGEGTRLQFVDREPVVRAGVALGIPSLFERPGSPSRGAGAMTTTPSPIRIAVSTESASRDVSGSGIVRPVAGSIGRPSSSRAAPSGASA